MFKFFLTSCFGNGEKQTLGKTDTLVTHLKNNSLGREKANDEGLYFTFQHF